MCFVSSEKWKCCFLWSFFYFFAFVLLFFFCQVGSESSTGSNSVVFDISHFMESKLELRRSINKSSNKHHSCESKHKHYWSWRKRSQPFCLPLPPPPPHPTLAILSLISHKTRDEEIRRTDEEGGAGKAESRARMKELVSKKALKGRLNVRAANLHPDRIIWPEVRLLQLENISHNLRKPIQLLLGMTPNHPARIHYI